MHVNSSRKLAGIRSARAVELRAAGKSFREIATDLGCSTGAAFNAVERGLQRWVREPLDTVVALELERLDRLLRAYWDLAIGRDPDAAAFVLRVLERRAKMLGLDAPKRVDVTMLVAQWAEEHGLVPDDVLDAVPSLLASVG